MTQDLSSLAKMLRLAQEQRTPCQPVTSLFPELTTEQAYTIQQENLEARALPRIGSKIGLTSRAVQRQLGVNAPDFGGLLGDMIVPLGEVVDTATLMQPRAEAEIAFVLGQDLDHLEFVTVPDIIRATAYLLPAIEIIDSRIADWKITYQDTIADNASSGLFVLGQDPVALDRVPLERCGMALRKNGSLVSTGAGAASMGHPLTAMAWLANTLGKMNQPLKAGQIILSGALGPVTPVVAGDAIQADIAHLGQLSVRFV